MKKYLRELEVSGLILVIIGIVCSWIWGSALKDKQAANGTFTIEGKPISQVSLPQNQVIIHNGKKMVINTNSR